MERFNGRISEGVQHTRCKLGAELESTLRAYGKTYNHPIPKRSLDHRSPVQPERFHRAVHQQAGLDTYHEFLAFIHT